MTVKKKKLTLKQEMFCQEYVDNLGNGTKAALKIFTIKDKKILEQDPPIIKYITNKKGRNVKDEESVRIREEFIKKQKRVYDTGSSMAREYLRKLHIMERIDKILDERGFDDKTVKREHSKLLRQDEDYGVKMRAISDYYKLKGKYEDKGGVVINLNKEDIKQNKEKVDDLLDKIE